MPISETERIWNLLISAHKSYYAATSTTYDEVLWEVAQRAEESGSLGKLDIGALVVWKRLSARTRWASALMGLPDAQVRAATGQAMEVVRDTSRSRGQAAQAGRAALVTLPGFYKGDALASAVLTAAAPHRMAVYDSRAQRGLESLGLTLTDNPGRYGRYMDLLDKLLTHKGSFGPSWTVRDIDIALFWIGGK
ncbi:hypothetical protein ACFVHI_00805 [Kitasatospora sp. NPDC127121]|uniref:hypothetical protein n=1 Tax=unclassified Kitasatospora TaxID=2633591 RepID=UPI00362C482B